MDDPAATAGDTVLRRLPMAAWRTLPTLFGVGVAVAVFLVLVVAIQDPFLMSVGLLVVAPASAVLLYGAICQLSEQVFDLAGAVPIRSSVSAAVLIGLIPGALAALTVLSALAASQVSAFWVVAFAAGLMAALSVLLAMVALPIAAVRREVGVRAVLLVSLYALVRRPLVPLGTAVVLGAAAGASLSWSPALGVLLPGLAVLLSYAAAWTVAIPAGVEAPPFLPSDTDKRAVIAA